MIDFNKERPDLVGRYLGIILDNIGEFIQQNEDQWILWEQNHKSGWRVVVRFKSFTDKGLFIIKMNQFNKENNKVRSDVSVTYSLRTFMSALYDYLM